VEIKNGDTKPIQLENWTLSDGADHVLTFPGFVFQPEQTCRVHTDEVHSEWRGFNYSSISAIVSSVLPSSAKSSIWARFILHAGACPRLVSSRSYSLFSALRSTMYILAMIFSLVFGRSLPINAQLVK
jgi:hypothetical protein